MCTYLDQVGSTYYFRRVVPLELRPFIRTKTGAPRAEWKLSLGTKDRETAKRALKLHALDTDRLIDEARAKLAASAPAEPVQPVSGWAEEMHQRLWERSLEGAEMAAQDAAEKEARYEARAPLRRRLERAFRKSTAEITPEEAAMRDLLRDMQHAFTTEQELRLAERVRFAEVRRGLAGPLGEVVSGDAGPPPPQPAPPATSGKMLDTDILDLWAAERKPQPKTKDAHRAVACWFYERAGTKAVDQITRQDVLAFKDKLIAEGQEPANINTKLSRLRTLLQWAADNDHAPGNAAKGITVKDGDKGKNKRKPFDLANLTRVFTSPVFSDGQRPTQGRGEAAYWLPLLALFTGARLEELGQLRPADVHEVAYPDADGEPRQAWFIAIQEDEEAGLKLKTAGSERQVPVHPELVRLGFLHFAADALEAKQERLFPALRADKYGRLTAKWGEWFGSYLRETCGVTDPRMVFHSFRHTFKQYARLANIIEGVQRQIMGHSSGDVADQYGSGYPPHQIVEGMRLYRVPGLILPSPPTPVVEPLEVSLDQPA